MDESCVVTELCSEGRHVKLAVRCLYARFLPAVSRLAGIHNGA